MSFDVDKVDLTDPAAIRDIVRGCWEDALLFDDFGDDDDFFDIGGHSVLIAEIVAGLVAQLGGRIPFRDFFQHSTVNALSSHIQALAAAGW